MASSSIIDSSVHNRLQELFGYIRSGRILDAINEFYAEDAVMQGAPEDGEPGTVCEVLLKGYQMEGTVLRHAMVKVVPE